MISYSIAMQLKAAFQYELNNALIPDKIIVEYLKNRIKELEKVN
jgi:hypothetical protein